MKMGKLRLGRLIGADIGLPIERRNQVALGGRDGARQEQDCAGESGGVFHIVASIGRSAISRFKNAV